MRPGLITPRPTLGVLTLARQRSGPITAEVVARVHRGPTTCRPQSWSWKVTTRAVENPTPDDCERGPAEAREQARKIVAAEGDPMPHIVGNVANDEQKKV